MSRINSNIPSMVANRVLAMQNSKLNLSLQRLSTGLRINNGKDDPSGLIASEAMRAEQVAIKAAIGNVARATNVVSVAEGGLVEINALITELENLVDRSANEAGLSDDEVAANQLQIDSILQSINRIANSTEFQGKRLLSGDLGYTTSSISTSDISSVRVNAARLANDSPLSVVVEVVGSAQQAQLTRSGATVGASAVTLEVSGRYGAETFSFAAGTNVSAVAAAINAVSNLTGVEASVAGTEFTVNSTGYGTDEFVTVSVLTGTFDLVGGDNGTNSDRGSDASVTVNGVAAATEGLHARVRTSTLDLDVDLGTTFGQTLGTSTFYVVGGGANFMIAPKVNLAGMESIGIASVSSGSLGDGTVGYLSSLASGGDNELTAKHFADAQRIVRKAANQISALRGRLGAFEKNTLQTTANSLNITLENLTAAESLIRDTDFAEETSNLTRQQILTQAATNVLRLANAQPQQVLALLG
jgi:flagellin